MRSTNRPEHLSGGDQRFAKVCGDWCSAIETRFVHACGYKPSAIAPRSARKKIKTLEVHMVKKIFSLVMVIGVLGVILGGCGEKAADAGTAGGTATAGADAAK